MYYGSGQYSWLQETSRYLRAIEDFFTFYFFFFFFSTRYTQDKMK
jgi:hypothetical protein